MGTSKKRTTLVLAASAALAVATIAPSAAQEAPPAGIGSSSGSASLLNVLLGDDALSLRLLGEDSQTTNDAGAGGPLALERLTPLSIASSLLPALGGASQPTLETRSTEGEDSKSTPAVDLGGLLGSLPVPGLLDGTIDPVTLRSAVDANGAVSGATGAVRDLSVLGGLLSTGTASADLGSGALLTDANALRGLQLDRLEVLDLTALLDALGISLADLPLDTAVGLLDSLGLPLPGGFSDPTALLGEIDSLLDDTGPVRTQVATLQAQLDSLQAQLTSATASIGSLSSQLATLQGQVTGVACSLPLPPAVCGQITTVAAQLADANALVATLNSQIDTVQGQIDDLLDTVAGLLDQLLGLLDGVLGGLDGAALLSVEDLVVGVTARADETLDSSVASVVGSVGAVKIGSLDLGGLDGGSALGQVTALTDQITDTLDGVLSRIDPSLAGLVDIDLLEQTSSVTESDGVTEALAGITALRATITPPDVCALLDSIGAGAVTDTVGSVLDSVDAALPSLPVAGDVLGDLGSVVDCGGAAAGQAGTAALVDGIGGALTQPLTVEALSLTGAAAYTVPATPGAPVPASPTDPTGAPTLPRTGGEAQLAVLALALGAAGYGVRRLLARSAA